MATQATIIVIIGISGDLAKRKLLPAIGKIQAAGALPNQYRIIGVTRRSDVAITDLTHAVENPQLLEEHCELFQMDLSSEADYKRLGQHIHKVEHELGGEAQRLFYLSVPPQISQSIIELLGTSGLAAEPHSKLLLEKPFGIDLANATELLEHLTQYFHPEQVYRIDHYLAKEMAQNLIIFREHNSLFKRTWNHQFIERIEILASETIGIEGRATFYEQTGALRDIVQSHLLQLAALTLMDPPPADAMREVPKYRLQALQKLSVPSSLPINQVTRRGQYEGYRQEVGNSTSTVETFTSLTLHSSDPRWHDVPIILTTGKALASKTTEIRITYRRDQEYESSSLTLRLQPNEGVEILIWTKVPGYAHKLEQHNLRFSYTDHFSTLPEAYEQVFLAAINSDHTLFTTNEEVLETWRILEPIQKAWDMNVDDLILYPPGANPEAITQRSH